MFCPGEELCILLFNAEVNVTTKGRHKKDVLFVLIRRAFSWAFHQMCSYQQRLSSFYHYCSWIFYEKPKFQGRKHVLEEGEAVLDHLWDLPGIKHNRRNLTVGSIKHVTKVQTFRLSSQHSHAHNWFVGHRGLLLAVDSVCVVFLTVFTFAITHFFHLLGDT